jgi:hypothetical protein
MHLNDLPDFVGGFGDKCEFHTVLSVGSCHNLRCGVSSVRDFLALSTL